MDDNFYQITLQERVGAGVTTYFPEFTLTEEDDKTIMRGRLPDQSALHGVLNRIRDLGLTLISVETLTNDSHAQEDNSQGK